MDLTQKQFEKLLRQIVREEISGVAKQKSLDSLQTSVDGLAAKLDAHLNVEWHIHTKDLHPKMETRLKRVERKLGIKTEPA